MSVLQSTLEATDNGIFVITKNGKAIHRNRLFAQMWQIPEELINSNDGNAMLNFAQQQLVDPQEFICKVETLISTPAEKSFDILNFKDGRIFEQTSLPMLLDGKPDGRVWSFRDVTERKLAELKALQNLREKETLIRELYHRTKNTMQVIISMLGLQAGEYPENKEIQKLVNDTKSRIQSIAHVHQMLYQSQDLSHISIKKYIQ